MLNIFAFGKAQSVEELKFDGDKYLYKSIPDQLNQEVTDLRAECDEYEKKAQPPLWFKILQGVLLIVAFVCTIMIVLQNKSLVDMIATDLPLVIVAGVSMVGLVTVLFINRQKEKNFTKTEEFKSLIDKSNELIVKIRDALGIAKNAKELDVLAQPYKVVDGVKVKSEKFDYLPLSNFVYLDGEGKLCVADLERVYAVDKKDITKISYVNGPILLSRWTKETAIKDAIYKDYDLKKASSGMVRVCGFYAFEIQDGKDKYYLAVAPYDAKEVARMIGKKLPAMKK